MSASKSQKKVTKAARDLSAGSESEDGGDDRMEIEPSKKKVSASNGKKLSKKIDELREVVDDALSGSEEDSNKCEVDADSKKRKRATASDFKKNIAISTVKLSKKLRSLTKEETLSPVDSSEEMKPAPKRPKHAKQQASGSESDEEPMPKKMKYHPYTPGMSKEEERKTSAKNFDIVLKQQKREEKAEEEEEAAERAKSQKSKKSEKKKEESSEEEDDNESDERMIAKVAKMRKAKDMRYATELEHEKREAAEVAALRARNAELKKPKKEVKKGKGKETTSGDEADISSSSEEREDYPASSFTSLVMTPKGKAPREADEKIVAFAGAKACLVALKPAIRTFLEGVFINLEKAQQDVNYEEEIKRSDLSDHYDDFFQALRPALFTEGSEKRKYSHKVVMDGLSALTHVYHTKSDVSAYNASEREFFQAAGRFFKNHEGYLVCSTPKGARLISSNNTQKRILCKTQEEVAREIDESDDGVRSKLPRGKWTEQKNGHNNWTGWRNDHVALAAVKIASRRPIRLQEDRMETASSVEALPSLTFGMLKETLIDLQTSGSFINCEAGVLLVKHILEAFAEKSKKKRAAPSAKSSGKSKASKAPAPEEEDEGEGDDDEESADEAEGKRLARIESMKERAGVERKEDEEREFDTDISESKKLKKRREDPAAMDTDDAEKTKRDKPADNNDDDNNDDEGGLDESKDATKKFSDEA